MLINCDGRRFVNEALGYNDVGRGMLQFDPGGGSYFCASAWLVFDADFRERRPVLGVAPGAAVPDNWRCADTIEDLANMLSVPADELVRSVTIMNDAARSGCDREFDRGGDAHQTFNGEAGYGSNPCLGIIAKVPFFTVPISPVLCGTKGGLEVDADARVIGRDRKVIDGLYACGDVASSIMGFGYAGAGASIGPAMTSRFSPRRTFYARVGKREKSEFALAISRRSDECSAMSWSVQTMWKPRRGKVCWLS